MTDDCESNATLFDRAISGDEAALVALLEEAGPSLLAEMERQIGAKHRALVDAEDLFQITCMEAFLRIRGFVPSGPGSFMAWLRRIARNNLLDAIKELERDKRPPPVRRIVATGSDESYRNLVERLAVTTSTPSRAYAREELQAGVEQALRQLPQDYETALRLYELEGLSAIDIAQRMGKSHGAVRMLLARARQRLAEILLATPQFQSRT